MKRRTDRRSFLRSALALSGAAVAGCGRPAARPEDLPRLLGLQPDQRAWLKDLTVDQQQELASALSPGASSETLARAEQLLMKVIGPRDRLFAFVGYPPTARQRTVCDGVLQE